MGVVSHKMLILKLQHASSGVSGFAVSMGEAAKPFLFEGVKCQGWRRSHTKKLYTLHSTLYTPHSPLYTPHPTLRALHFTLLTLHSTLCAPHSTFYTARFACEVPFAVDWTFYTAHFTFEDHKHWSDLV